MDRAAAASQLAAIVAADGVQLVATPPQIGGTVLRFKGIPQDLPSTDLAYGRLQSEEVTLVALTVDAAKIGNCGQGWTLEDTDNGITYHPHFRRPKRGAPGLVELIVSE